MLLYLENVFTCFKKIRLQGFNYRKNDSVRRSFCVKMDSSMPNHQVFYGGLFL